jgi:hypothetical protein
MTGSGTGEFRGTAAGGGDLAAAAREILGRLRGLLAASRLGAAPRRTLWVAERLDLGPKKSLWLVACGERRLLVAGGGEAIAAMLDLGPAADAAGRIPVVLPARWMAER